MRNNIHIYAFIVLNFFFTGSFAGSLSKKNACRVFEQETLHCYEMSFESINKQEIPLTKVPKKCQTNALKWIKTILKKEWISSHPEKELIAYKDVLFKEWKDSKGRLLSKWEGDILSLKYQINGIDFRVNELGGIITIMITYPNKLNISSNPTKVVSEKLRKHLNFPKEWTPNLAMKTKDSFYLSEFKKKDFSKSYWWETIRVFGGSDFLFLIIAENDGTPMKICNHPGLDDRF